MVALVARTASAHPASSPSPLSVGESVSVGACLGAGVPGGALTEATSPRMPCGMGQAQGEVADGPLSPPAAAPGCAFAQLAARSPAGQAHSGQQADRQGHQDRGGRAAPGRRGPQRRGRAGTEGTSLHLWFLLWTISSTVGGSVRQESLCRRATRTRFHVRHHHGCGYKSRTTRERFLFTTQVL